MTRSSVDLEEAGPASFEELRVRDCSIKRTLDVIGERWTLLVLREAFYGARRFEQFLANVGCARTLLSERLATLVEHGVLQREPYREAGQRERHQYLLTEKGHDLFAALVVLMHWGDRWEAGPQGGPVAVSRSDGGEPVHVERRCRSARCAQRLFIVNDRELSKNVRLSSESQPISPVVAQGKTGRVRPYRDLRVGNPLVAGSSPARPTSERVMTSVDA